MAIDKLGVINSALLLIGAEKLSSLTDSTKSARLADTIWQQVIDELFAWPVGQKKGWKFCTARAELSRLSNNPAFGTFDYQYALPANCIRIVAQIDEAGDETEYAWQREVYVATNGTQTDVILTNQTEVFVKYIVPRNDVGVWPAWFRALVILKIAIYLSEPIKQEGFRLPVNLDAMFDKALSVALSANGLEDVEVSGTVAMDFGNNDVINAAAKEGGIDAFEALV